MRNLTSPKKRGGKGEALAEKAEQSAAPADSSKPTVIPHKSEKVEPASPTKSKAKTDWKGLLETALPFILLVVGLATRYYRLDKPTGVVFDEFHFGRFTNQLVQGTYLFDIHPPLGKLMLYWVARLVGYDASICDYSKIDLQYHPDCKYIYLRAVGATFGGATVPLVYLAVRYLGGSLAAGLTAALLFNWDNINLEESRLILIDGQLIFWCTASLVVGLAWLRSWRTHQEAVLEVFEQQTGLVFTDADVKSYAGQTAEGKAAAASAAAAGGKASASQGVASNANSASAKSGKSAAGSKNASRSNSRSSSPTREASSSSSSSSSSLLSQLATESSSPSAPAVSAARRPSLASVKASLHALLQDSRYMTLRKRLLWILAMGVTCANAVSIKFTGLASPGMIAVESFFALFILLKPVPFSDLLGIAGVVLSTYVSYYAIHFDLLPLTGDGDMFMPKEFQRTLINNTYYDPLAEKPSFWKTLYDLNIEMVVSSNNIKERHHWDSLWWEWPLNLRGLAYYSVDKSHTYTEAIYLLANPLVVWPVFAGVVLSVLTLLVFIRYKGDPALMLQRFSSKMGSVVYCLTVYVLNLLPYVGVARSCFNYHYMPALVYGEMLTALLLVDLLGGRKYGGAVARVLIGLAFVGWLYYSPWIYAFPLTSEGHARRRWLPRWN